MISIIKWLEEWFADNCDGEWEHVYKNVRIQTLDNPGWLVRINLIDTQMEDIPFDKVKLER
ncbi:Imm53 family immunity protein [Vallitalea okinawensis]|uniref:Imm53 family immunity protein n=1 Tax=Vallitalea okinawensis TaxID=2078660 RepID=UPI0038CDBDC4